MEDEIVKMEALQSVQYQQVLCPIVALMHPSFNPPRPVLPGLRQLASFPPLAQTRRAASLCVCVCLSITCSQYEYPLCNAMQMRVAG